MKNKFKFLLIIIFMIPIIVLAEGQLKQYFDATSDANNYINKYTDRNKYILLNNVKFKYENRTLSIDPVFTKGGLLNKSEFDLSVANSKSYLMSGREYWTMTDSTTGTKYYVDNFIFSKQITASSGVRVTEYVKSSTRINGKGTYGNPWVFEEGYEVTVKSNNSTYATITPTTQTVKNGGTASLNVNVTQGFKYANKDDCNLVKRNDTTYEIRNVTKDISCVAIFEETVYKMNLTSSVAYKKSPVPSVLYYRASSGWHNSPTATAKITQITPPTIVGYTFKGYKYGSTQVINSAGKILVNSISGFNYNTEEQNLTADITANQYTCSVGQYLRASDATCQTCLVGSFCPGGTYTYNGSDQGITSCPTGYTSDAGASANTNCYINVDDGKYKTTATGTTTNNCAAGTYKAAHKSYYNSNDGCSNCTAGTYSLDGAKQCTNCPSGFTSDEKATAQNKCYISVGDGQYKTTKTGTTVGNCTAGTYKGAHKGYYNVDDACDTCPSGFTSAAKAKANTECYIEVAAGQYKTTKTGTTVGNCTAGTYKTAHKGYYNVDDSCDTCPTGFTSAAKAGAQNQCYIEVAAGQYKNSKTGTGVSNCAAGTYKAKHNGYYNVDDSCDTCPSGFTSDEKATAQNKCYISVAAGQYKNSKTGTGVSNCAAGTYKTAHKGYYNVDDSCDTCPSGFTSAAKATAQTQCYIEVAAGQYKNSKTGTGVSNCAAGTYKAKHNGYYNVDDSCDNCPTGYTSAAKATANTSCYISVSGGKHKTTKTGTTIENCAAGTYSTDHKAYYNADDNCTNCSSGYTSSAGATSCTPSTYTVVFNSNGGSGNMSNLSCQVGANCTLTANAFTKDNSTFMFWSTNSGTTVLLYDSSENSGTAPASSTKDFKIYTNVMKPSVNEKYGLEVDVKGSGQMHNYLYGTNSTSKLQTSSESNSQGSSGTSGDGHNVITTTSSYQHLSVSYTFASSPTATEDKHVMFRLPAGGTGSVKNVKFYKKAANESVYIDSAAVKNIASAGGTITLYAIWKTASSGGGGGGSCAYYVAKTGCCYNNPISGSMTAYDCEWEPGYFVNGVCYRTVTGC